MSIIAIIKIPVPKVRHKMPPPCKAFKDRKKEADRKACRKRINRDD